MIDFIQAWCFAVALQKDKLPSFASAAYVAEQVHDAIDDYKDAVLFKLWKKRKAKTSKDIKLYSPADLAAEMDEYQKWRKEFFGTERAGRQSKSLWGEE